jgi:hypothetical protein
MRRPFFLLLPVSLVAGLSLGLLGCKAMLKPYEEALRQVHFELAGVSPSIELAFPLDRSKVNLDVRILLDNGSDVPLVADQLAGTLRLQHGGEPVKVGDLSFPGAIQAKAKAKSETNLQVSLGVKDLGPAWTLLRDAFTKGGDLRWELEGSGRVKVYGIFVNTPFRVGRTQGIEAWKKP